MRPPLRIMMTVDTMGGVWSFAMDLIRALEMSSVEILLVSMGAPISPARSRLLHEMPHVNYVESHYPLEWMDNPWSGIDEAGEWLLELAKEFQPSIVHLNGYCHAALPWQVPVLITAHSCIFSWWTSTKKNSIPHEYEEYRRRVTEGILAADLVVAPTHFMLRELEKHYTTPFCNKVIYNGCNAKHFPTSTYKQPVIFSAGRLWDEAKNFKLLNYIAPHLQLPIRVAGEQHYPYGNQKAIFSNLEQLGCLSRRVLQKELAQVALYVSPALYEPFGLTTLEAALSGCALVLSDIPTYRELWDNAAVFCPPNDENEWIRTLNHLAANPLLLKSMGIAARRRAHKFSAEKMGRAYLLCYQELQTQTRIECDYELIA